MPSDTKLLEHLYERFNARDMEAALATMQREALRAGMSTDATAFATTGHGNGR